MLVQRAENVVCYDVDNTLVEQVYNLGVNKVVIKNPNTGSTHCYRILNKNVELLKSHKGRGFYIKVWSAAGYAWAEAVVKALHLKDYVDAIETKPNLLVDDLTVQEIFPHRIYLKD